MSGPGAGFEYAGAEVTWLKRDVLLFANSIGCTADELHFLYVSMLQLRSVSSTNQLFTLHISNAESRPTKPQELHPNFSVFPTYPIILRKT
jgi:peroxisomal enoyl-CoA hydratase 2